MPEAELATSAAPELEASLCSKCGENPRAHEDSTNPWCNPCKTKYMKEYTAMKARMSSEHAFSRGVTAMRSFLVGEFERLGSGAFTGFEIASLINGATSPKMEWKS